MGTAVAFTSFKPSEASSDVDEGDMPSVVALSTVTSETAGVV